MKNKTLAIFGIGTYILSIFAYAENLEGTYVAPSILILASTIATVVFVIMATIRIWKGKKITSIIYLVTSAITLVYTIPLIRGINTLVFIWVVSLLWTASEHEGAVEK